MRNVRILLLATVVLTWAASASAQTYHAEAQVIESCYDSTILELDECCCVDSNIAELDTSHFVGDLPPIYYENPDSLYPHPINFIVIDEEAKPVNLEEIDRCIILSQQMPILDTIHRVNIRVLSDSTGRYIRHIVIRSTDPLLRLAVEQCLPQLRFTPAEFEGHKIAMWVNIRFLFKNGALLPR